MIAAGGGGLLSWLDAVVLGVVEGVTEFLPVSSTGHLIVAQRALGLGSSPAMNAFAIGIQLGAISAILALYWRPLVEAARALGRRGDARPNLLYLIAVAAAPAAALGLLLEDVIDDYLFSPWVVAGALVVGGVLLLALERHVDGRAPSGLEVADVSYRAALAIGFWQCLALIPGTSRSGASIGGAMMLGLSRTAAAEFSFLLGLPVLYGASTVKLITLGGALSDMLVPVIIGTSVSFCAALVVVRPFLAFLRRRDFRLFAYYRIAAGGALFVMLAAGALSD
ncbi:MAG: undecaprenyl-diphosphate phosphatase [Planctomycetota bacterium]|nr:undecaprenyl-diphosphate phosphatase [Planctomycetota bacterium]